MSSYRIRAVDPTDDEINDEIKDLHKLTFGNSAPLVNPATEGGHWWLAYEDQTPAAFAGLSQSTQWMDTGYLNRIGVLDAHRGHGLQRRLIRVRAARAKRLGYTWLVTDTTDNPPSANNLIREGFLTFAPTFPWSGMRETIYWRKKLC